MGGVLESDCVPTYGCVAIVPSKRVPVSCMSNVMSEVLRSTVQDVAVQSHVIAVHSAALPQSIGCEPPLP